MKKEDKMNKWVVIPIITILAVGIIVGGYFLWQQTSKLGEAESEIVILETTVSTLEGDIEVANSKISNLREDVSYQRVINLLLVAELKKVTAP
ncbi:hypothetical protein ES703_101124 [subsurface metagenome]